MFTITWTDGELLHRAKDCPKAPINPPTPALRYVQGLARSHFVIVSQTKG